MNHTSAVETIIDSHCSEQIERALVIDERYAELWREIQQYLLKGGKRMRPRLVLMAYAAYGGKHIENVLKVAAAWEMLHASLLVHDDIIDRDTVRHGHPNIAGRYQSKYSNLSTGDTSHYALSAALLGGNLLLMSAYELISNAQISSEEKLIALSYLNKAIFAVAGGELIDTDSVLYPIHQSNPSSVAKYKTASYSLQLPLQCGAALAGASGEELEKLDAIGLHTGIAFQLRDDLLGVFGDSVVTGKSNRSDIIEKKRTYLINETLKNLNPEQASSLTSLFETDRALNDAEGEEIIQLIVSSGAKEKTEDAIESESLEALQITKELSISDTDKEQFMELIKKLTTRTS